MDPEDVASLLAPYHARLKEELERYGGTVEKFIGDAVMALFGAPVSHEDDAERAVRAALAIRDFAEAEEIELRIGIATGEALVTLDARPDDGETMAAGDVVNTGARLQAAAPVNGILVSQWTYQAAKDAIDFRMLEPISAKGKAGAVPVWEVVSAAQERTTGRSHAAPLVGRTRELDLLAAVLDRACVELQPQLVTLVGVPGIGKSRLVHELATGPDSAGVRWLHGRCLPYGDGVTFWALAEIVRAQLGVSESAPVEVLDSRLDEAVSEEWIKDHLRPLLGLETGDVTVGDRGVEAYAAWRTFFEVAAAEGPLGLVFEDMHWADEVLLDFVDQLVDWAGGVALFVVCTTRPELLEKRAAWGGGKDNATTISLAALSDEETSKLVGSLLERPLMSADLQSALLARAGGNPLYAEQFARLVGDEEGVVAVPETVQALIAARLDGLTAEQKAVLQDASVIGRTFWLEALTAAGAVDAGGGEQALHALQRKGFVRRERASSVLGATEYVFQHVIVADVAYGQIPRAARSERHRLAAEWIAAAGGPEDTADFEAYHYEQALSLARAAGLQTSDFEEPARRALLAAADRALDQSAYAPAARLYGQALDLGGRDGRERAAALFGRARAVHSGVDDARFDLFEVARDALIEVGDVEAAALAQSLGSLALRNAGRGLDSLEQVCASVDLLHDRPASRTKTYVAANYARLLSVLAFENEEALRMAETALDAARALSLTDLEAHCLNTMGVARIGLWEVAGVSDLDASVRIGLEHCSPFEVERIYNNAAAGYFNAGLLAKAAEANRAALDLVRRTGMRSEERELQLASFDADAGRWQEAWDCVAALRARGTPLDQFALMIEAPILFGRDDVQGAVELCEQAIDTTRSSQRDPDVAGTMMFFLGFRAQLARAEGREDIVDESIDELLGIELDPAQMYPALLAWLTLVLHDFGLGDRAAAMQISGARVLPWHEVSRAIADGRLVEASDRLEEMGAVTFAAEVRMSALRELVAENRRAEADEQRAKVLAFYCSVGATRFVREAENLLPQVA
jgi:hypothetical protein